MPGTDALTELPRCVAGASVYLRAEDSLHCLSQHNQREDELEREAASRALCSALKSVSLDALLFDLVDVVDEKDARSGLETSFVFCGFSVRDGLISLKMADAQCRSISPIVLVYAG